MLDNTYIRVTIDRKVFYREIRFDDSLGDLLEEDDFHHDLFAAALKSVVTDEFKVNVKQIGVIIDRINDKHDRQILRDFVEYAVLLDGDF